MKLGVIFPQLEIGTDPIQIRDFVQGVEALGFDYLSIYDHVLGADTARYPDMQFVYTYQTMFHEPMVLFGYLAALTQTLELSTGIIVLPQRDARLVAKQAVELALLSQNRLRLGVGGGWNKAEMEGLGYDFHTRGARMDEQIAVMKALWAQPLVDFEGKYHTIKHLGLNPLPTQPIALWMGGHADAVLRRVAESGDGWIVSTFSIDQIEPSVEKLRQYGGGDKGIDVVINPVRMPDETDRRNYIMEWRQFGATHARIVTMGAGYTSIDQHLKAAEEFKSFMEAE